MKKIFLFLFSFFIFPLLSFAVSNVDYDVTNYYIKANILSNGDLKVKELIVLKGSFNGYERTINYRNSALNDYGDIDFEHSAIYNSDGIKDVKVSAKYLKNASYSDIDDTDFESFEEVSSAYSGDKRKYTLFEGYDGNTYTVYVFVEDPSIKTEELLKTGKNRYKVELKPGKTVPVMYAYIDQDVVFKSSKGEIAYWDADNQSIVSNRPGKAKLSAKVNGKTITINVFVR